MAEKIVHRSAGVGLQREITALGVAGEHACGPLLANGLLIQGGGTCTAYEETKCSISHSLGGLYMQYYARNFPNDVTGLVLVDSSHPEQFERLRVVAPAAARDADKQARDLMGIVAQENAAFELSGRQVLESPPLRPMPLIVLSAGQPARGGVPAEFWAELQRELAAQLPGARHTIAERSGHLIQERQPQYVWAAVRDIVIALRGQ